MHLHQFRILIGIFIYIIFSFSVYSSEEGKGCFNLNFSVEVEHSQKPLGLTKSSLKIVKDKCVFRITRKQYFFLEEQWQVDVCREPIHLKHGKSSFDVYKREGRECSASDKDNEFCRHTNRLFEIIEDEGLIFAKGNRLDLTSSHGKVYCGYNEIKKYLINGEIATN